MGFRVGIRNIAMTDKIATIVVVASDELNFTIGVLRLENQDVLPGESEYFLKDLLVPATAFIGVGRAVANALKAPQGIGSVTWCPSVSTAFSIGIVHDVAVVEVVPSVKEASRGQKVNIRVVVANLGGLSESFSTSAYANATLVGTIETQNLASKSEKTLVFSWFTDEAQLGDYVIQGVAKPVPDETYLANNVLVDGIVKITSLPVPTVCDNRLILAFLFVLTVLVAALLVAAVLVFLFCRRRRRKDGEEETERAVGRVAVLPLTAAKRKETEHFAGHVAVLPSAAAKNCKVCGRDFLAVYTFCPHCLSFHGKDFE
jgi:hypothetical protein